MQTTSGSLTFLSHRLGMIGLLVVVVLAVALALALTILTVSDILAAGPDPIQVSPVRWLRRC